MNNEKIEENQNSVFKENYIEGRNAVLEALRANDTKTPVDKLFVLKDCHDGPINTIVREAKKNNVIINFIDKDRLNKLAKTTKHQGVLAICAAYNYSTMNDIFSSHKNQNDSLVIVLDNIEDPMNLGAIIRTANIAGAAGVIIHSRHAALLSPAAVKASAGAVSHTPIVKHTNITSAIKELKDNGFWCVCADMDGESMYDIDLKGKVALIMGNEGKGVSRLAKEACDFVASIPMIGEIDSLNVSVATGVITYEILRQRGIK